MGIQVQLEQLEGSTEGDREARGAFDAALGSWTMASSPLDPICESSTTSGVDEIGDPDDTASSRLRWSIGAPTPSLNFRRT